MKLPPNLPPPTWCDETFGVALYHGDCLDVLRELPAGSIDAVVTDPPYGIKRAAEKDTNGRLSNWAQAPNYGVSTWDNETCDEGIAEAVRVSRQAVVFGGNFYDLPPTSCWLVWDKMNGVSDFADCELAWTNLKGAVRLKRYMWNGMIRENREPRGDHPTQKPVPIMAWAVGFTTGTVCDPFMGSGTTGVAAVNLGRAFIGVELERKYFEIAVERIRQAIIDAQDGPLFAEHVPEQLEIEE
ncbi:MAG: site-specific DNA-methyltransferase [Chloroflexi bacterium]|nr:site-specific DNA-methyltransferase [Chloroflexota bacterium]